MRPNKQTDIGQQDLFRNRLDQIIDLNHPLARLTKLIDWDRILGVAIENETQIILVDTPGIFSTPKRRLEKEMVHNAWDSLSDADGIMLIVNANQRNFDETENILKKLEDYNEELPYAIWLETESWEEFKKGNLKINQIIYVQRDSLKPIVLVTEALKSKPLALLLVGSSQPFFSGPFIFSCKSK